MSEHNETPDEVLTSDVLGESKADRRDPHRSRRRAAAVFGLGAAALAGMAIATSVTGTDHTGQAGQAGHVSLQSFPNTTCCFHPPSEL